MLINPQKERGFIYRKCMVKALEDGHDISSHFNENNRINRIQQSQNIVCFADR